jgi:hypothetical protein
LPTAEDLAAEKEERKRIEEAQSTRDKLLKAATEWKSGLEEKKIAWTKASREDREKVIDEALVTTNKLHVELTALSKALDEGPFTDTDAEKLKTLGAEADVLGPAVKKLIDEQVVEKKVLDEAARKKAERFAEMKRKREEEARRKAAVAARLKAQESAREKAAQEKAEKAAKAQSLAKSGDSFFKSGRYAGAIGMYKQSLRLKNSTSLHLKLGKAYNAAGDYKNGAKHLNIYLNRMKGKLPPYKEELIRKQIRQ